MQYKYLYTVCEKTIYFVICHNFIMPAPICIKFGKLKEQTQNYKMHIIILKYSLA